MEQFSGGVSMEELLSGDWLVNVTVREPVASGKCQYLRLQPALFSQFGGGGGSGKYFGSIPNFFSVESTKL